MSCHLQLAAQCPVVDHHFNDLNHLANCVSTKESMPGNDSSNHSSCVYKPVFRFKPTIFLSGIIIEMDIQQLAVIGMCVGASSVKTLSLPLSF